MKPKPITMPVLSDTMESGLLSNWLKQPGDPVKRGDALAEIESDKAVMEVEAFDDGYLAGPLAQAGSDIPVRSVIAYIVDSPEKVEVVETDSPEIQDQQPTPAADIQQKSVTLSTAVHAKTGRSEISPYARGLAHELGVDLATVKAGPDGVIRSTRVMAVAMLGPAPDLDAGPPWRYKLLTPMHRAVAENMTATLSTPTFRVASELAVGPLRKAAAESQQSFSLLLARALALGVLDHPQFNAIYDPPGLVVRKRVDVGIAVDVPGGLLTPVIRDAAIRPIAKLAGEWRILKDKIKQKRLMPEDYSGATVYLSNLGVFDIVSSFEAIVPPGAAAILAVGAARNGIATFTLSCDHRVIFGADAARFMQTFAGLLANPEAWL